MDDIRESVDELRYWRGTVFRDAAAPSDGTSKPEP
jgi:oligoribonuclease (3'-5' exoribonuclease)